jgi:hypothetical protein
MFFAILFYHKGHRENTPIYSRVRNQSPLLEGCDASVETLFADSGSLYYVIF